MDNKELANRFQYHPPKDQSIADLHGAIRRACETTAAIMAQNIPDCRELSLAITKLEEAMMWANAAIARNMNE